MQKSQVMNNESFQQKKTKTTLIERKTMNKERKNSRRHFLKTATAAMAAVAVTDMAGGGRAIADSQEKPMVYFTEDISAAGLLKVYAKINQHITGNVAIKIHTGEPHGPNIIPREMVKTLQQSIPNSKLVETNTLYEGKRKTTKQHRETIHINGWDFCEVDIMDEDGAVMLPVKGGKHFKEMSIAKNMLNYDSMLVLTHFKGHAMGGYGGSLKNIAIGCADGSIGKRMVHAANDSKPIPEWLAGEILQENMVESAKATIDYFGKHIVYINVLRNMSVDCDCAGIRAAKPTAPDIGILASTDILAIDQASIDMVYALPEHQRHDLQERIESRKGLRQLTYMKEMKMGNDQYELIKL
ncbi:MAG: DUF362 domain-containing protein [Planctomycetaceae bacterium]|jgi:uncharacterized Fe-S center protein|nr:DUF362 domain-containing protein [Planctomycetaceae bacterium]